MTKLKYNLEIPLVIIFVCIESGIISFRYFSFLISLVSEVSNSVHMRGLRNERHNQVIRGISIHGVSFHMLNNLDKVTI